MEIVKDLGNEQVERNFVRTYLMYQMMQHYPHLISEMRKIFLRALSERGIANEASIEEQALEIFKPAKGTRAHRAELREYANALIDMAFAANFSDEEITDFINLARKEDIFCTLLKILNNENTTYAQIRRALSDFCAIPKGTVYISHHEAEGVRVALIDRFISNQLPFIGVAKKYITIRDIDEILAHTLWNSRRNGLIGGKAAGMLCANRILLPLLEEHDPDLDRFLDIPESYFVSSGTLADFVDHNNLYYYHDLKYGSRNEIEERYNENARLIEHLRFSSDVVDQFRELLDKIGEHPIIIRSSSHLEDNFGHAFSGKYDSIFLANQGELELRLNQFIIALKKVHGSVLALAPILYRRDHHLLDFDEQMGVLVQKVVGRRFGDYFFPTAAGVAFSHNAYNWSPRIKQEDGLVRLVFGLGTRAVDRVGKDYPRMVPLSHPLLRPEIGANQISRYSQRLADVLNLRTGELETLHFAEILKRMPYPDSFYVVSSNEDGRVSAPLFRNMAIDSGRSIITFENLLTQTPFPALMKKILTRLEQAYGRPVDIEFAWDNNRLFLLQCRPLLVTQKRNRITIPESVPHNRILFSNDTFVSNEIVNDIEYIVYVDPRAYSRLGTLEEKFAIGRVVNRLNGLLEGKRYALFGPGRWGSNDINLGVRVGYEDINRALILGEIAFEEGGSTPEVSYGTHFFIDLVEASIVPIAIFPDKPETVFREAFFVESPNQLGTLAPAMAKYAGTVHVVHVPSLAGGRLLQVYQDAAAQRGIGFLGHHGEYVSQVQAFEV